MFLSQLVNKTHSGPGFPFREVQSLQKITTLFGSAASIHIPAAVALLYVRCRISYGCFVDERKLLLTSTDILFISLSERFSPIALAEKIENGRFLYRKKRRVASSKAIRSIGSKLEIIRRDSLCAVLCDRVIHFNIWYCVFLSLLIRHFFLRQ